MTPGYSPQTYQPAPYTPPGAGASALGQPWQAPPSTVQRSPNKRVVPHEPDGAPGLWAADVAPRASVSQTHSILDIVIEITPEEYERFNHPAMGMCTASMDDTIDVNNLREALMSLSKEERRCVAHEIFRHCAETLHADYARDGAPVRPFIVGLRDFAQYVAEGKCDGIPKDGRAFSMFRTFVDAYRENVETRAKRLPRRLLH